MERFKITGTNKTAYWVPISIPAKDIPGADLSRFLEIEVHIHITVSPDGTGNFIEYTGDWALPPVGNHPKHMIQAISAYLKTTNVVTRFNKEIQQAINQKI